VVDTLGEEKERRRDKAAGTKGQRQRRNKKKTDRTCLGEYRYVGRMLVRCSFVGNTGLNCDLRLLLLMALDMKRDERDET